MKIPIKMPQKIYSHATWSLQGMLNHVSRHQLGGEMGPFSQPTKLDFEGSCKAGEEHYSIIFTLHVLLSYMRFTVKRGSMHMILYSE
jgi:hypothetical protein